MEIIMNQERKIDVLIKKNMFVDQPTDKSYMFNGPYKMRRFAVSLSLLA